MRICIIGAGASGICAARRLLEASENEQQGEPMEIRVFEQCDQLGGTWVLDESEGEEVHSSLYANMRTNLPREMMQFDHFPFLADFPEESSYPPSDKVLAYLHLFARPILHLIEFNSRVLSVVKNIPPTNVAIDEKAGHHHQWTVTVRQGKEKQNESGQSADEEKVLVEHFDVLFVCPGHYSTPRLPPFVDKLDRTKLPWTHSHSYRRAEHFRGKTVAVVGAAKSGIDIALQLAEHAKKVYLLHMTPSCGKYKNCQANNDAIVGGATNGFINEDDGKLSSGQPWETETEVQMDKEQHDGCPNVKNGTANKKEECHQNGSGNEKGSEKSDVADLCGLQGGASSCYWSAEERPPNCEERYRVVDCTERALVLADGTELGADDGVQHVIFCTGYRYEYPFLEGEGLISCPHDGAFVTPLWANFVHPSRSLFMLGLIWPVIIFSVVDAQVQLAVAILQGRVQQLPAMEEMLAATEQRIRFLTNRGLPLKHFHRLDCMWTYIDWLDRMSGRASWRPPVMRAIDAHFRECRSRIRTNKYQNIRYVVKNDEEFEAIQLLQEEEGEEKIDEEIIKK